MEKVREAAKQYASIGLRVVPVAGVNKAGVCLCGQGRQCKSPGKHPMLDEWPDLATTDPATIDEWFGGSRRNVGIATGSSSGVFVVDIDGDEAAEWIRTREMPPTWTSRTGSGGTHYWFKYPADRRVGNSTKELFEGVDGGVDIKGDRGQAVAPPSRNARGEYTWYPGMEPGQIDLAEAPAWLLEALQTAAAASGTVVRTGLSAAPLPEVVPDGQRHRWLLSLAGSLRERGADGDEILDALRATNTRRCRPPLEDNELRALASDVATRYAAGRLLLPALPPALVDLPADFLVDGADYVKQQIPEPEILIGSRDGHIQNAGEVVTWHGSPRSLKTWAALSAAIAVATGRPWLNSFPTRRGVAVYLQEETAGHHWVRRVRSVLAAHGAEAEELRGRFFTATDLGFQLDEPPWIDRLVAAVGERHVDLLVIDPLAFCHSADENSSAEMLPVIAAVRDLRRRLDCGVVVVAHNKKGETGGGRDIRGSSSWWAAFGTVSFTSRGKESAKVSVQLKDSPPPEDFEFSISGWGDGLQIQVDGPAESDAAVEARQQVLDLLLRRDPEPLTVAQIVAETGLSRTRAYNTCAELDQAGEIVAKERPERSGGRCYRIAV